MRQYIAKNSEHIAFALFLIWIHLGIWLLVEYTMWGIIFVAVPIIVFTILDKINPDDENYKFHVVCDEDGISVIEPSCEDHIKAHGKWDELLKLEVLTNSSGPWGNDCRFNFEFKDDTIVLPFDVDGIDGIFDVLKSIEDYDEQVFIEAMSSTKGAKFVCLDRTAA